MYTFQVLVVWQIFQKGFSFYIQKVKEKLLVLVEISVALAFLKSENSVIMYHPITIKYI
jgi:hypothetical protein